MLNNHGDLSLGIKDSILELLPSATESGIHTSLLVSRTLYVTLSYCAMTADLLY